MKEYLEALQEEFHASLNSSKSSNPRDYQFPKAQKLAKTLIATAIRDKEPFYERFSH